MALADWTQISSGSMARAQVLNSSLSNPVTNHSTYCISYSYDPAYRYYLNADPSFNTASAVSSRFICRNSHAAAFSPHLFVRYNGTSSFYAVQLDVTNNRINFYQNSFSAASAYIPQTLSAGYWYGLRIDTWRVDTDVFFEVFFVDSPDVDTVGAGPEYELPWVSKFSIAHIKGYSNFYPITGSPVTTSAIGDPVVAGGQLGWGISADSLISGRYFYMDSCRCLRQP